MHDRDKLLLGLLGKKVKKVLLRRGRREYCRASRTANEGGNAAEVVTEEMMETKSPKTEKQLNWGIKVNDEKS